VTGDRPRDRLALLDCSSQFRCCDPGYGDPGGIVSVTVRPPAVKVIGAPTLVTQIPEAGVAVLARNVLLADRDIDGNLWLRTVGITMVISPEHHWSVPTALPPPNFVVLALRTTFWPAVRRPHVTIDASAPLILTQGRGPLSVTSWVACDRRTSTVHAPKVVLRASTTKIRRR